MKNWNLLSASTRFKSLASAAADLQLILKNIQDGDQMLGTLFWENLEEWGLNRYFQIL